MYLIEPIRDGKYVKDGAVVLAMQVYVQSNVFLDDDILFPYYCDPKVEIGKFQNTIAEVNEEYLKENKPTRNAPEYKSLEKEAEQWLENQQ